MIRFTDSELHDIDCALGIAAGIYDEDARVARAANSPRIADQFDAQARKARALAERIAEAT